MDDEYLSKGSIIDIINGVADSFDIDLNEFDIPNFQQVYTLEHTIGCQFMWVADIVIKIPSKSADCKDYLLGKIRIMYNNRIKVKFYRFNAT